MENYDVVEYAKDNRCEEKKEICCERRNYPTADALEEAYNIGYRKGYCQGFEVGEKEGFHKGFEAGEKEGFKKGYKKGNEDGFEEGYEKGNKDGCKKTKEKVLNCIEKIVCC